MYPMSWEENTKRDQYINLNKERPASNLCKTFYLTFYKDSKLAFLSLNHALGNLELPILNLA